MILTIVTLCLLPLYPWLGWKKPSLALVTVPFVCAAIFYLAILETIVEAAVLAPVIFLFTLITIAFFPAEPEDEKWPRIWARRILIALLVLFWLVIFGFFSGVYGFVLLGFVTYLFITFGISSRHATAAYVISTIGAGMRQNLPLPMALECAAAAKDRRAKILQRIRHWLVEGYSLSEALKRGYPKCPGYAVAMIAAAEKVSQLPNAIAAIEADMVAKAEETRKTRHVYPLYPVIVIVFTSFVAWGLGTFVFPQFQAELIGLAEGVSLPCSTQVLLKAADFAGHEAGITIGLLLGIMVLLLLLLWLRVGFRPRRPHKPYLVSRIGDFLKWHVPISHWFENNYSTAQTVQLLRVYLNAGCTVNQAIANTLDLDVNNCFKKRLRSWLAKVEAGENIAGAARQSKLSPAVAWAFDDSINQQNTMPILETLESLYRSNYSYAVNLARFIFWPCTTLTIGCLVGFVCYAVFAPMVSIIHNLADTVIP
jgi:type II secretory pathway component PulF